MFLTGSRGEWGYIRPILRLIKERNDVKSILVVTNMHLLSAYGSSYKEIEADGYKIDYKINMSLDGYNHFTHAKSLGICLTSLPDILETEKPDWMLLAGDRGEQFMGAIAGAYTYTPIAHIQAGECSGNIDGMARHAIGKLAHLHLAANEDAAKRLIKLGEEEFRVYNVGAPQIDEMIQGKIPTLEELNKLLSIDISGGYILAIMHPVTEEMYKAGKQAELFVKALNRFNIPKIVIFPNNDAGSNDVKTAIEEYREGDYFMFANLKREYYLGLLKNCECIVGNSSSGLLEAPTYKIPTVNIGRRQNLRCRGINVIDTSFNLEEIVDGINKALSDKFRKCLKNGCKNPYGDGHSADKILSILLSTKLDNRLLVKDLTY